MLMIETVSAGPLGSFIWDKSSAVICGLFLSFLYIGAALLAVMIVYGGTKWMGSGDDPGARKQAKDLIIHAVIGAVILIVGSGLVYFASGGELSGCV